ncbi:hypothetical protein HDV04_001406 [Boothiomyces sp. JEL0838]|nr:hypothetical protein HDV04_001406 [Boothiomyces sp. JEL0838]
MRIKVQVDLNSPFKSWYSISDRFHKFSSLLDSLSADFGFDAKDISMTMDGFELPLFLDPFSILKEDDLILISRKRNGKRKIDDSYINTKKHKPEEILDTKKEQESTDKSDAGESDENSDSSESESSESSSDSDSSSSSETDSDSSSDESEETKAAEAVLKAVDPKLVKTLHKNKRKAVNNMLHVKPLHQKFDQNEPKVFNTKVELFNAPGTFSQNQMKRHRKLNKEAVPIEIEEDQEYEETEGWEEAPNEETNVIEEDVNQNEQDDMEVEDNNEPITQALDAIDYNELPVLKEPKENAEIVYKTLELSLAYTAEISDYKRARILSFIPTKKSFKVVLQKLNPDIPKMPSSAWEPKIYDYIFPKARKFEIASDEQDDSTDNTVEVDWKDLIEVRLIK